MKRLLLILLFPAALQCATPTIPVQALSQEEVRLVELYRTYPEAFRDFLAQLGKGGFSGEQDLSIVGPRDIIDVTVEGGQIAFYGKRKAYEPSAFRIARGEERTVIFTQNSRGGAETKVTVAYRSDGLHFDIPQRYNSGTAPVRGRIVIPEDKRWRSGEGIPFTGELRSDSQSEAIGVSFKIRYAGR